jgi:hypothetical protein
MESLLALHKFIDNGGHFDDCAEDCAEDAKDDYGRDVNLEITKIVNDLSNIPETYDNTNMIGRLVSRYLVDDIGFDPKELVQLLDFIDWHYPSIIQHSDDWTESYEQAGVDFSRLLHFAIKNRRTITGLEHELTQFGILIAIFHCDDIQTERFVINNNIKIDSVVINGYYSTKEIEDWCSKNDYDLLD